MNSLPTPILGITNAGLAAVILTILIVWSLIWKGLALWQAARRTATIWFVVLMILNTVGILEILYIYVFSKRKTEN